MKQSGLERGRAMFLEEARELVEELETLLLELESAPDDPELINRAFRVMHTLKGSGAMFGFDEISSLTHEMETIFDLVRTGKMGVSRELIELTLAVHDRLGEMLEQINTGGTVDAEENAPLIERMRLFLRGKTSADGVPEAPSTDAPPPKAQPEDIVEQLVPKSFRVVFRPQPHILASGTNPLLLLGELRELGECTVVAQMDQVPRLDALEPETCCCYWNITLVTEHGEDAIRDVFIFVEDDCELSIGELEEEDEQEKKLGEILLEQGNVDQGHVLSALTEQQVVRERQQEQERRQVSQAAVSTIRVPFWKLNTMVDLVGELVTVQARLSATADQRREPELTLLAEEVERLTADLRDNTMGIRMLHIGSLFSRFKRLVRDLSSELGKDVALTMEGEETELDKTVIEQLNDPLVHIIRNSMSHGIETPEQRAAVGKPGRGNIHLSAKHVGASVLIRVQDDGRGFDAEAIRTKAVERRLISPDAELSESDLQNLILTPGFSTSKAVNNLSGRGVGMDVVKKNIESLSGQVSLNSAAGKGATLTLKLPLTLAIIEGLLVKIGGENYVIPLASVDEVIELQTSQIERRQGGHVAQVRGELIPYLYLRELFGGAGKPPEIQQVVVVEEEERVGFVVDYVVGEYQTVIKNLGVFYKDITGLSGATILGDGSVALILDVLSLIQMASQQLTEEQM